MGLSTNDRIALATLILSVPSLIATILGVIISYRSLKQFQAIRKLNLQQFYIEFGYHH